MLNNLLARVIVLSCLLAASLPVSAQLRSPTEMFRPFYRTNPQDADPFSVESGIYYRTYQDLFVEDTIPINFMRTQRNMDPRSRSFGRGSSTSYDMFIIGDVAKFSWVALVLADGTQLKYARISPGTGYADGVFEDRTSESEFMGSRISWNGRGAWTVKRPDGMEYTIQGCSANSKPGQCAVSEIRNAEGERLVIRRDKDGNILRIESPYGHYVAISNDSAGRITKVQDDSSRWVSYEYGDDGCLSKARNWRGDVQQFAYDSRFNMTSIREATSATTHSAASKTTIVNRYYENNRFKWQKVTVAVQKKKRISTVRTWSVRYQFDARGQARRVDVQGPDGPIQYFFNAAGYQYLEVFRPGDPLGWSLDTVRDPENNLIRSVNLNCGADKIPLPASVFTYVFDSGDAHKRYLSAVCKRVRQKTKFHSKPAPKRVLLWSSKTRNLKRESFSGGPAEVRDHQNRNPNLRPP